MGFMHRVTTHKRRRIMKTTRVIYALAVLLFSVILLPLPSHAGKSQPLVIAIDSDSPPLAYIGASGKASGFFVDLWKLWGTKVQREVRFLPASPAAAVDAIQSGRADLHGALPAEPNIWPDFDYAPSVYSIGYRLYTAKTHGPDAHVDDLAQHSVGVRTASAAQRRLKELLPGVPLVSYSSQEAMILAAYEGRLGAFCGPSIVIEELLSNLGLTSDFTAFPSTSFRLTLHPAIPSRTPELSALVRKGFMNISSAELSELEQRWVTSPAARNYVHRGDQLGLTEFEKKWLGVHPVVRVAVRNDTPPLEFVDIDGEFKGITKDILDILAQRLSIRFQPVPSDAPERSVDQGRADLLTAPDLAATGSGNLIPTQPYLSLPIVGVLHTSTPTPQSIGDLEGHLVATTGDPALTDMLKAAHPKIKFLDVTSPMAGIDLVASGAAHAYVGSIVGVTYALDLRRSPNLHIALKTPYTQDFRFGTRPDWPELRAVLGKAITTISTAEQRSVEQKWLSASTPTWRPDTLSLSLGGVILLMLALSLYWNRKLSREAARHEQTADALSRRAATDSLIKEVSMRLVENDYETAIMQILPILGQFMQADRSRIVEFKTDGESLALRHEWCAPDVAPLKKHVDGKHISLFPLYLKTLQDGRSLLIRDNTGLKTGPEHQARLATDFGVQSLLYVPIKLSGPALGCLCIDASRKNMPWHTEEIGMMELVAEIIAIAKARNDAERDLHESRERYKRATFAAAEGLWEIDLVSEQAYMSHDFWEKMGFDEATMPHDLGSWLAHMPEDDRKHVLHHVKGRQPGDTAIDVTYRIKTIGGSMRWIQSRGMIVDLSPKGEPLRATGIHVDVTTQKKAERDLRLARISLENAKDGILWITEAGAIVYSNTANVALLDYSRWELLALAPKDICPDFADEPWSSVWERLHEASPQTFETLVRAKSGILFPAEVTAFFINYEDQDVLSLTIRDISLQKKNQQQLENSRKRYKSLYESASIGIILFDGSGMLQGANPRALELLQYEEEDLIGLPPGRILGTDDTHVFNEAMQTVLDGHTWTQHMTFIRRDGSTFPADTSTCLAEYNLVQMMVRDTTETHNMERNLRRSKDEADAANRAKSVFLSNISHEIRTPMNGVLGLADLLSQTGLSRRQYEYVMGIKQSGEILLSIINDILEFTKIEEGRVHLSARPFSLRDTIVAALQPYSFLAETKGLTLVINIAEDTHDALLGDAQRLTQVLANLVSNAIKFTEAGEVRVDIAQNTEHTPPNEITFTVSDTGRGIPQERQAAVFKAFEQAEQTATRNPGGVGMGLTVASRLVRLMGGTLSMQTTPGVGSSFFFTISFDASPVPIPGGIQDATAGMRGRRCIIVDGNPTSQRFLRASLEQMGLFPMVAANGKDATKALEQAKAKGLNVEVIIVDESLPDMPGSELISTLKANADTADIPVVLLQSRENAHDENERHPQVAATLHKPLLIKAIHATLSKLLPAKDDKDHSTGHLLRTQNPRRILLAEDTEINRNVALNMLEQFGHKTTVAHDGKRAVDLFSTHEFDLVIMDVQMPIMNGMDAAGHIRALEKQEERPRTPIIAMTAHLSPDDRQSILHAGMDDLVSKPIRPQDLFSTIERNTPAKEPADSENGDSAPVQPSYALDRERLAMSFGSNTAFLKENIAILMAEVPSRLAILRQTFDTGDFAALAEQAHAFKGTIGYFDEGEAFTAAYDVEQAAIAKDTDAIERGLKTLSHNVEGLLSALHALP